jgi:hypothetical protein
MRRRLMDPATMTVVGLNSLGRFTLLYTPGWRRKKPMDRFVLTGKGWTVPSLFEHSKRIKRAIRNPRWG